MAERGRTRTSKGNFSTIDEQLITSDFSGRKREKMETKMSRLKTRRVTFPEYHNSQDGRKKEDVLAMKKQDLDVRKRTD